MVAPRNAAPGPHLSHHNLVETNATRKNEYTHLGTQSGTIFAALPPSVMIPLHANLRSGTCSRKLLRAVKEQQHRIWALDALLRSNRSVSRLAVELDIHEIQRPKTCRHPSSYRCRASWKQGLKSSNTPSRAITSLPLAVSSAGVPYTTSVQVLATYVSEQSPLYKMDGPCKLWPHAWPKPSRASYSQSKPILGPPPFTWYTALNAVWGRSLHGLRWNLPSPINSSTTRLGLELFVPELWMIENEIVQRLHGLS